MARVGCKVREMGILKDILKDLGFELAEGKTTVKAMDGKTTDVVAKVKGHDFGVEEIKDKATGEVTYGLAGEFYRTKWYGQEQALSDKINRNYAGRKAQIGRASCRERV